MNVNKRGKYLLFIVIYRCRTDVFSMVVSMTGYGRSENTNDANFISVEVRTVNHRYFEFHIRMPRQY